MQGISRRAVLRCGAVAAAVVGVGGIRSLGQFGFPGQNGFRGQGGFPGKNEGAGSGTTGSVTVRMPLGTVRGKLTGDGVRVFRGLPFAQAPVGDLRFRPTERAKPWKGVRDATEFRPMAAQSLGSKVGGSEDCLYLNVWAPAGPGPFPVYVWIHGGGFTGGAATAPIYDGTEFAQDGVVLVTVAYRLGVFGFLDLGPLLGQEYAGSGNNAMRDLVMALRWVRENIGAFGGDPGRVTIGGESAGAKATAGLMAIPEAEGLFQSMISESGGGERVWGAADAAAVAIEFGEVYRGGTSPAGGSLPELKTASAERLIETQAQLIGRSARHFPFRSEVDGRYLTGRPVDVVAKGSARGKRLLLGSNREESALFLGAQPGSDPKASDLGNLPLARFDEVFARYAALYPAMSPAMRRIRAVTAEEYWVPSVRLAEAHVSAGGQAWMYRLDYASKGGKYPGEAYHSEDLPLVFDKPNAEEDAAGVALGRQMHAAWVAFVKGGVPAAAGLPQWPAYGTGDRWTMVLDRISRVEERPQGEELRLWDGVL